MRVRLAITVEVEVDEWMSEYGTEREDVQSYVRGLIDDSPAPMKVAPPRKVAS